MPLFSKQIGELDSGLNLYIETPELELTSSGALVTRFYTDFDDKEPLTYKPLAMVLNPEQHGDRIYRDDVWVLVYRRGYRVVVYKHGVLLTGPHAVKLYYQSWQTKQLFWLATLQIDGVMFYNEDGIYIHIMQAIGDRQFFQTERGKKDFVTK